MARSERSYAWSRRRLFCRYLQRWHWRCGIPTTRWYEVCHQKAGRFSIQIAWGKWTTTNRIRAVAVGAIDSFKGMLRLCDYSKKVIRSSAAELSALFDRKMTNLIEFSHVRRVRWPTLECVKISAMIVDVITVTGMNFCIKIHTTKSNQIDIKPIILLSICATAEWQ